jgi:hypothetical protein
MSHQGEKTMTAKFSGLLSPIHYPNTQWHEKAVPVTYAAMQVKAPGGKSLKAGHYLVGGAIKVEKSDDYIFLQVNTPPSSNEKGTVDQIGLATAKMTLVQAVALRDCLDHAIANLVSPATNI